MSFKAAASNHHINNRMSACMLVRLLATN